MSPQLAFKRTLEEYPAASSQSMKDAPLADFIRREVPDLIRGAVNLGDRYKVEGSPGKGNWARTPWICVFDRLVTTTAQSGYYLVYLFREDFSGAYLSL